MISAATRRTLRARRELIRLVSTADTATSSQSSLSSDKLVKNEGGTLSSHPSELSTIDQNRVREEILQCWMVAETKSSTGAAKERRARYCCYTYHDAKREYESRDSSWHWLDRELSSNLAGETGAVHIYKGALAGLAILDKINKLASSGNQPDDPLSPHEQRLVSAREFCYTHHAAEESHRQFFDCIVPTGKRTRLLPVWRAAGFSLGLFPVLFGGTKALYVTVEAVETFVEEHFQDQIVSLRNEQTCPELRRLLEACSADEVHHKDDAARHLLGSEYVNQTSNALRSWWVKPWARVVQIGSSMAAEVARRV